MLYENQRLADIISSWTKSSASLQKLQRATKQSGDKTGLGYYRNENSTSETSSNPRLFKAEEESCATSAELAGSSAMQAALSKLENENDELKNWS
ncbi:hypothetical protein F511_35825 [Dorcoceras hygrometricum]|uniref:Uncharacterized protein n=1 Tax=Dorcoceras hygrometricum TaxID=472368 RepID=A0A2Z7BM57_9LAMI|nr:hypothetical protein F511_35825 [Dorcoceras hygrometricum]